MLTNVLALIVGFGSLAIYLTAFFFPEVHRKNDFIWSGVGLFYALVLWVFAPRIGGWFFLGELASVALLFWFAWQTFSLRRQVTPEMEQTPVPSLEAVKTTISEQVSKVSLPQGLGGVVTTVTNILPGKKQQVSQTETATQAESTTSTTEDTSAATIDKTLLEAIDEDASTATTPVSDASVKDVDNTDTTAINETSPEATTPEPPAQEVVETASETADTEEKNTPPVEEIPPQTPPGKIPPSDATQG